MNLEAIKLVLKKLIPIIKHLYKLYKKESNKRLLVRGKKMSTKDERRYTTECLSCDKTFRKPAFETIFYGSGDFCSESCYKAFLANAEKAIEQVDKLEIEKGDLQDELDDLETRYSKLRRNTKSALNELEDLLEDEY